MNTPFHPTQILRLDDALGKVIPFPEPRAANDREGPIQCHEQLGGMLKCYQRQAA